MRIVARLLLAAAFLAIAVPELGRYRAERKLRQMEEAIRAARSDPRYAAGRERILARVAADALELRLPGDWRPLNVAGSALFASGRPELAAAAFSRALATGERPELAMNLGIALDAAGRFDEAGDAMVRAVWISPPLLLRTGVHGPQVEERIRRLEARLRAGTFTPSDLPPLPRG